MLEGTRTFQPIIKFTAVRPRHTHIRGNFDTLDSEESGESLSNAKKEKKNLIPKECTRHWRVQN